MIDAKEAADLLKRCTLIDLVKLLACKAAGDGKRGETMSASFVAEATAKDGPTMVARVRITMKRNGRKAVRR